MKLGKVTRYNINIEPSANNGFIVKVGCGRFVFNDVQSLISALSSFLNDPEKHEKEYNEIAGDGVERIEPQTACYAPEPPTEAETIGRV